ncbi:hypothetical protein DFH09DRAFT_1145206 [Mycena vulgaris]|nr:hypothetical protein DFH09DRAFT_1145206 [Mycena vulgaris]
MLPLPFPHTPDAHALPHAQPDPHLRHRRAPPHPPRPRSEPRLLLVHAREARWLSPRCGCLCCDRPAASSLLVPLALPSVVLLASPSPATAQRAARDVAPSASASRTTPCCRSARADVRFSRRPSGSSRTGNHRNHKLGGQVHQRQVRVRVERGGVRLGHGGHGDQAGHVVVVGIPVPLLRLPASLSASRF